MTPSKHMDAFVQTVEWELRLPTLNVDYAMVGAVSSILQVNEIDANFREVCEMVHAR